MGQDNLDMTTMAGQAGKPELDSQDRTAGTGLPRQDNRQPTIGTVMTGHPGENSRERSVWTV